MGRARAGVVVTVVAAGALGGAAGCDAINAPLYFNGPAVLTSTDDEDVRATGGLTLRFREPTAAERAELVRQSQAAGYDVPWISRDKVHVQLMYTIRNNNDRDAFFNLMVDGANEFTKYDSQVVADAEDGGGFLPLVQSGKISLAAGESYRGILREDDFAEGELDLDTLGRWLDVDTFSAVLLNRSDVTPIGMALVPPRLAVPALIEINVSLYATIENMTCEYAIRVRDDDDRLLHETGDALFATSPTLFAPPAAP